MGTIYISIIKFDLMCGKSNNEILAKYTDVLLSFSLNFLRRFSYKKQTPAKKGKAQKNK
jgi:hypothetical protein